MQNRTDSGTPCFSTPQPIMDAFSSLLHILDTILVHCILYILGTILVHCLI